MKIRILSFLVVLAMVFTFLPLSDYAKGIKAALDTPAASQNLVANSKPTAGAVVKPTGTTSGNGVAKIGDTVYETLAKAVEAAAAGDTILVYADIDSVPTINKAITIKGDGKGVKVNSAIAENFPNVDGTVTFENLTFNDRISTENASNDQSKMTLKFVDCTFNVPAGNTYAIQAGASWNNDVLGALVVENCIFNTTATSFTKGYMVYAQCVENVTVTESTFDGNDVFRGAIHLGDSTEYATVATISGNTIKNIARGVQVGNRVEGSKLTITGNTFEKVDAIDGETESATVYIHEVANAETTDVVYTDNEVGNSLVIFSENATGAVTDFVTTFTGNTKNKTAIELEGNYSDTVYVPETPAVSGKITSCLINLSDPAETFISSEITGLKATESVVIKLYSGETQIATTTLQKPEYYIMDTLGVKIIITGESSSWKTEWEDGMPRADVIPDKVVLYVDGKEMNSANVPMISTDGEAAVNWAEVPGVNPAPAAGPVEVATFEELVAALANGGEIKLTADIKTTAAIVTSGITATIDLNGKTLTIGAGDNKFNDASTITIKNGNVDITGVTVNGNAIICLDEYEKTLVTTLTLNDVNLTGNDYSSAYGIFYIGASSVLNVNDGTWDLANDKYEAGGVFKADSAEATLKIDGLDLTAHNVRRVVTWAKTTIKNSTMTITGDADEVDAEMEHGFNRSPLTVINSTITMKDMVGRGITAEGGAVTISDNSTVTITNAQEATIDVRANQTVTVDGTSTVTVDADPTITSGEVIGVTVKQPTPAATIGTKGYKTVAEALAAAVDGDEVVIKEAGTYAVPTGKSITITGAVDGVVFDMYDKQPAMNCNMTFNNVTFDYGNMNYRGLQHAGTMVYNNCTINGQVFLYGTSETFNNCTFNQSSADAYNVWTYGARKVEFNECTFNSAGKSVLVYNEGACATELNVVDTDFTATQAVDGKAAIEIDTSLMPSGTEIVVDALTTADGFATGSVSGSTLWNDKKADNTKVNGGTTSVVIVAGETVKDSVENAPQGALNKAYISAGYIGGVPAVFGEATGVVAKESFVVKLYSGETLVGTATLVDNDKVLLNGKKTSITWHAALTNDGDSWWSTTWEKGALNVNAIPDTAVLYVDGVEVSTCNVELNINDLEKPIVAAQTDANGDILRLFAGTGYLNGTGANAPVYDDALNKALAAGGNIVLLRDALTEMITVPANVTVKLDMAGHDITVNADTYAIDVYGKLTLTGTADSVVTGGICINDANSEVVMDTVTVQILETGLEGMYNVLNYGGKFTMNSGKLYVAQDTDSVLIALWSYGGTTVINGGVIESDDTYNKAGDDAVYAILATNNATVTVDGATVDGAGGAICSNGNATVTVKSGWFTAGLFHAAYGGTGSVVIENGTFTGTLNGKVEISGGTFNKPVAAEYCASGYAPKDNGDGTYGVKVANEAWIIRNDMPKFYATLVDAIKDAKDGETVILMANVTINDRITIDKNITIGDYGTLKLSVQGNGGFVITNNATLTIDNVNVDISGFESPSSGANTVISVNVGSTLNLNEVTLTGDGYSTRWAVICAMSSKTAGSTVNITDSTITLSNEQNSAGGFIKDQSGVDNLSVVNITNSTITLTNAARGFVGAKVNLNNVDLTITGGEHGINGSELTAEDSKITISGGTGRALTVSKFDVVIKNSELNFSNMGEGEIRMKSANSLTLENTTLNECAIYADVSIGATVNGQTVNGTDKQMGTIVSDGTTTTVTNPNWVAVITVNNVPTHYYISFAEALAAAEAGNTIKLLEDVTVTDSILIDKSLTIDLNGKTITSSNNRVIKINTVSNGAESVTIKNGTVISTANGGRCIQLAGSALKELTLDTVTLTATSGATQPITLSEQNSTELLEVTIKDSTITASNNNGYALIAFCPINATITNSTLSGYAALYFKGDYDNTGVYSSEGSKIVVKDSTLNGTNVQNGNNSFSVISFEAGNIELTVTGGSINANATGDAPNHILGAKAYVTDITATLDTTLNVGEGCGYFGIDDNIQTNRYNISVRAEYADDLAALGYAFKASGTEGMINVTGVAVAQVGEVKYATVIEALQAAVETGASEVKILQDVRELMPTDIEINVKANLTITADEAVTVEFYNDGTSYDFIFDSTNNNTITIGENVTFSLADRVIWLGYYRNDVDVVVNGTLSAYQIWHGADTTVSSTGTLKTTGEALVMRRGALLTVDGGKVDVNYFSILAGQIFAKNNADIDCGALWINNTGTYASEGNVGINIWDSTLTSTGNLKSVSDDSVSIDFYNSTVTFVLHDGYAASELDANTTLDVDGENSVLNIKNVTNNGTINVYDGGTVNVDGTLTNNGTVLMSGESNIAANVTGAGWVYMNGVTLDADTKLYGAKVGFINGMNNIVGSVIDDGWFNVGIGKNADATAAATFAATNGITLGDVTVNVSGDAVIGAGGADYYGWVGSAWSADKTQHKYELNIENSTASFAYLHVSLDGELNVTGNASTKTKYNNSEYSFYVGRFIVNGTATFDSTDVLTFYTIVSADNTTANPGTLNIVNGTEYEVEPHNGATTAKTMEIRNAGVVNVDDKSTLYIGDKTTIAADAKLNIAGTATALGTVTNNGTITLTDANATLTTVEGLTVTTNVADYKVAYADGAYKLVAKVYVAQIGDAKYESLAEALIAAQDGDTITLIWKEGDAPIAMNGAVYGKTVTITGTAQVDWEKGFLFVGRTNDGTDAADATLIFENANLTTTQGGDHGIHVSGTEKGSATKADGTVKIINSTINLSYLINKGTMTLDNSTLTVKTGFSIGGRPASETENGEDATATITLNNNSKLVVDNHNGMGLGYEAIGVMNVNSDSTFECTQSFLVTAKGTMNVDGGTVKVAGTLTNLGTINVKDATVELNKLDNDNLMFLEGTVTIQVKDGTGSSWAIRVKDDTVLNNSYVKATDNFTVRLLGDATINGGFECAFLQGASASKDGIGGTLTIEDDTVVTATYGVDFGNNYTLNGGKIVLGDGESDLWGFIFQNGTFEINTDIEVNGNGAAYTVSFTKATATVNGSISHSKSGGEPIYVKEDSIVTFGDDAVITTDCSVYVYGTLKSTGDVYGTITKAVNTAVIEISGGTYTQDVSDWCAPGFKCEKNAEDDTYSVVEKAPSATIDHGLQTIVNGDGRESVTFTLKDVFAKTKLIIELWSNGTKISTTTYKAGGVESVELTVNIVVANGESGSWTTTWHVAPSVAYIPDQIVVYADGGEVARMTANEGESVFYERYDSQLALYKALSGVYKAASVSDADGNVVDYYATLADAVADAEAGNTIVLLANIELTESVKISESVDVTIDLNGTTLTGPDGGKANWYAFIVDGGDLTLKDSIGTGELWAKCYGVETKSGSFTMESGKITATNNSTLGSAVVNYGGTVTINGGTVSGNLAAVYTGGYFSHASTIINNGTLIGPVVVEDWADKTYTETVTSAFNTYEIDTDYKWVENDGVYVLTAKVYVAQIGDAKYETLADALADVQAGETLTLTGDVEYNGVIAFMQGFTLDLNGYTLKASGVVVFANGGNIVDNGTSKGLLAVVQGYLVLNHADYPMLPVWNEDGTGYEFYNVEGKSLIGANGDNGFKIWFRPEFDEDDMSVAQNIFKDGISDNGLSMSINIVCKNEDGSIEETITYVVPEGTSVTDKGTIMSVYSNTDKVITLVVTGADAFDSYDIELVLESDTGLKCTQFIGTFTNSNSTETPVETQ